MVVALTITETNYPVVSLFCDVVLPIPIYKCDIKFFGYAICLVSGIATIAAMPSRKSFTLILAEAHQAELFPNNCSL